MATTHKPMEGLTLSGALTTGSTNITSGGHLLETPITARPNRFSLLRFKHASDPQLSTSARQQALVGANTGAPTLPPLPVFSADEAQWPSYPETRSILDTSGFQPLPSIEVSHAISPSMHHRPYSSAVQRPPDTPDRPSYILTGDGIPRERILHSDYNPRRSSSTPLPAGSGRQDREVAPPQYTDPFLNIPPSRQSQSSRSNRSSCEQLACTTTTTHTVSTTTTIFRLPRRKKHRSTVAEAFAVPDKDSASEATVISSGKPEAGTDSSRSPETGPVPSEHAAGGAGLPATSILAMEMSYEAAMGQADASERRPSLESTKNSSRLGAGQPQVSRRSSFLGLPRPASPLISRWTERNHRPQAAAVSSASSRAQELDVPIDLTPRTSTSTLGRSSISGLFSVSSRWRGTSEVSRVRRGSPHSPYAATPNSSFSKSNSLCLSRSQPPLPERLPDESPANYLLRLEQILTKGQFASALGQSGDQFHQTVLRSYMRRYPFFGDPIDMSIRKLLMEAELPKEAQQIDRVLEGFAERYHECNPGIYSSADQAYFIAFSLLILHTDVFNKNNRRKMQKADYVRNTQADSIDEDVLGCFYDNIAYTPFIQIEDDTDPTVRTNPRKERRAMFSRKSTDNAPKISRPSKTPVDPYTLIIEKNLSVLRPNLKEILNFENPYSFVEQGDSVNTQRPRRPHNLPSVLQIMSLRSRPEAFNAMPSQIANSQGQPGLVELRVNKVGILWRKEPRMKKKARSPWQEWGALLTTSQLHLFKNPSWVRSLMHQQEQCARSPYSARSQFFSPPIEKLLADASYPIANTVALIDSSYKKHKNALTFTNHGSLEEVFLANDERDLQEWMCKLNHAAALSTVGLKQREELIGPGHDRSRALGAPRPISIDVSSSTGTGSETKHHDSIVRHSMLRSRIAELEEKVAIAHKQLDSQMQNARHVQLLTPILPRTRTQIISAAARVAAQIRWRRIEVCKLSCHREALSHELSVDPMLAAITKAELTETVEEDQEIVHAGNHSGSATDGITERSGHSLLRDTTAPDRETAYGGLRVASLNCPPASSQLSNDASSQPMQKNSRADVAQTQQDLVTDNSFHDDSLLKEPSKDSSLPRHVRASSKHSSIGSLSLSLQSTDVEATPSREHDLDGQTDDPPQSSVMEKRETRLLGESGSGRSLHRTLRDNKSPSRQRRQKARQSDASQSFVESLYDTDETTLPRTTGSFNVHGKKASVVTFGNDWQSTSAEERLRLRKQAAQLAEVG